MVGGKPYANSRGQDAGSATVNHINPKMIDVNQYFADHLELLDKASVIENAKIRVCLHVYSDSDLSDTGNLKHLVYSVDCNFT